MVAEQVVAPQYIDGAWQPTEGRATITVVNPADESVCGAVVAGDAADVDRAVRAARAALPAWSAVPLDARIDAVERLAQGISERRDEIASVLTTEMGSPISFSRQAQVGVALADLAELVAAARQHVERVAMSASLVVTEPVGVVAAITPWNFPLHQIVLKVGAALLAGCTVVLKPSEVAPLNAVEITRIIDGIGLPAGVFNLVNGDGRGVGEPLTAHPDVDMVTFTGSRGVGESIARTAAATIKNVALELGGKSAAIILDDAPIDTSAEQVLRSCFANSGQTCAALTRVLVPRAMKAEWEAAAVRAAAGWTLGDPESERTVLGPLASMLQLERVREHVERARSEGARVLIGDEQPAVERTGAWMAPVIFTDVTPEMSLFRDEVFGPVLAITPYDTVDEAVALANDSVYGLAGGVWSEDPQRALSVALRIRTGTIGINGAGLDVGAPFGGVKQSGVGRECGVYGFQEFLETKAVMGAASLVP